MGYKYKRFFTKCKGNGFFIPLQNMSVAKTLPFCHFLKGWAVIILLIMGGSACFAQTTSAISTDAAYRTGRLTNGFSYYVRANNVPNGHTHFVIVQKPDATPFFHLVTPKNRSTQEGLNAMYKMLREQRIVESSKYRPHLQGIIIVGDINPDSTVHWLTQRFADLPASVDVLQAQDVPQGIDSALAAVMFTAKPLPPSLQNGFPVLQLSYPLPALSREQRMETGYYVMDFLKYVVRHAANARVVGKAHVSLDAQLNWETEAPPEEDSVAFMQLAGEAIRFQQEGVTPEEFETARVEYIHQVEWEYANRNSHTHEWYVDQCIHSFLEGSPMPSATWKYRFIKQLVPFVTVDHVNLFVKGVMYNGGPNMQVLRAIQPADSLVLPRQDVNHSDLMEQRRLVEERVAEMMFPMDEAELISLTMLLMDIDLRLHLDSLERTRVVHILDQDSLRVLYNQALRQPIKPTETPSSHTPVLPPAGRIEARSTGPQEGVLHWRLSNGSHVYLWPDSLYRGQVHFAALERNPISTPPYIPEDTFHTLRQEDGFGTLSWRHATQGVQLEGSLSTHCLPAFLNGTTALLWPILRTEPGPSAWWQDQEGHRKAAQEFSRTFLIDSLQRLLYLSPPQTKAPSCIQGFDYVFAGDFNPDSLAIWVEQSLAGLPSVDPTPRHDIPDEGIRRGIFAERIPYPNPAEESKSMTVFSGSCPYTREQYILLQLLEEIIGQATRHTIYVQATLEFYPRGHYFLYLGYSAAASDAAYNQHLYEQILTNLAAYGPGEDALQQAKEALLIRYQEDSLKPAFRCATLLRMAANGKDFMTGYAEQLQLTDQATVRDFVRQIMEYGNRMEVSLDGAAKRQNDASYSKNP